MGPPPQEEQAPEGAGSGPSARAQSRRQVRDMRALLSESTPPRA
jgi:hypothetical protein